MLQEMRGGDLHLEDGELYGAEIRRHSLRIPGGHVSCSPKQDFRRL
jgi:hypothetical protein